MKYKFIGFDADDTLWVNEPFYRETERPEELLRKRKRSLGRFRVDTDVRKDKFQIGRRLFHFVFLSL